MTKFKSDMSIKVEALITEQQRKGFQIRDMFKMLEELRKHVSIITEGLSIALAVGIAREAADQNMGETVKVSSLIEGWVLEIEEKTGKYRG